MLSQLNTFLHTPRSMHTYLGAFKLKQKHLYAVLCIHIGIHIAYENVKMSILLLCVSIGVCVCMSFQKPKLKWCILVRV